MTFSGFCHHGNSRRYLLWPRSPPTVSHRDSASWGLPPPARARIHLRACPPLRKRGPRDASDPSFEAISSLRHGEVPPSCPVVVHRHPRDPSSQPPHDTRPCSACLGPPHSRPRPGLGPDRATPLAPLPPLCAPRTGTDAWLQSLLSPGAARPAPAEPQAPPAAVTGPGPGRP